VINYVITVFISVHISILVIDGRFYV